MNEALRDETIELLQALIRNACVNDGTVGSGHEYRSVATLTDYLGDGGTIFEPKPGRQSVLLAVDATNGPANRIYDDLGFVEVASRGPPRNPIRL